MLCISACALHVYISLSIFKLNAFDSACGIEQNSEEVHTVIPKSELSCAYAWEEGCLGLTKVYTWFCRKVPITRLLRGIFFMGDMLVSAPWTYARTSQRYPFTISVSLVLLIGIPNKQEPYAQPRAIMFSPRYLKCLCRYILYVLSMYNWFMHYILLHHIMCLFIYRPQLYTVQNLV